MIENWENPSRLYRLVEAVCGNFMYSPFYRGYIKSLGLRGTENILDFGSGSGAGSRHLAGALQNGGSLTCVDTSRYWTGVAKKRMRAYNHVRYYSDAVTSLGLAPDSFDAVYIHYALHEVLPKLRSGIMAELFRLLKPGGRLYIREPRREYDGIPTGEIKRLMSAAGFKEVSAAEKKSTFTGVYTK